MRHVIFLFLCLLSCTLNADELPSKKKKASAVKDGVGLDVMKTDMPGKNDLSATKTGNESKHAPKEDKLRRIVGIGSEGSSVLKVTSPEQIATNTTHDKLSKKNTDSNIVNKTQVAKATSIADSQKQTKEKTNLHALSDANQQQAKVSNLLGGHDLHHILQADTLNTPDSHHDNIPNRKTVMHAVNYYGFPAKIAHELDSIYHSYNKLDSYYKCAAKKRHYQIFTSTLNTEGKTLYYLQLFEKARIYNEFKTMDKNLVQFLRERVDDFDKFSFSEKKTLIRSILTNDFSQVTNSPQLEKFFEKGDLYSVKKEEKKQTVQKDKKPDKKNNTIKISKKTDGSK